MLHIIPIQEKTRQAELARVFSVQYEEKAFAYVALDDETDGRINALIGFMQFVLTDEGARVLCLVPFEGVKDDEAMQIMARAAFAFIHRVGVGVVRVPKGCAEDALMLLLRMEDCGEHWKLDLDRFFSTKCSDR